MVHESAFWHRGILPHAPIRVNLEDTARWGHGVTRRIIARESTSGAVHGEENLKDQSRWEDMFTLGRQICSQATMRSYLTPIRLQKPRSPNACRLEWSNKICHMSRVMCEETTPYSLWRTIWQHLADVESSTPLCQRPLPGPYPREFLTPVVKLCPELLRYHCSFWGKFEATLEVQCWVEAYTNSHAVK